MCEEILAAAIRGNEAETLGIVEPLYGTCCHVMYILKKMKNGEVPRCENQDGKCCEEGTGTTRREHQRGYNGTTNNNYLNIAGDTMRLNPANCKKQWGQ